jgi:hypothetical protein
MNRDPDVDRVLNQYLDSVTNAMGDATTERRKEVRRELSEHFLEALAAHTAGRTATAQDAYTVLSTMDSPSAYANSAEPAAAFQSAEGKLAVLAVLCSLLQAVGLAAVVLGVPVIGAVAGFAAIVNFFISWSNQRTPRWSLRLSAVAAVCGLGIILFELSRAM